MNNDVFGLLDTLILSTTTFDRDLNFQKLVARFTRNEVGMSLDVPQDSSLGPLFF